MALRTENKKVREYRSKGEKAFSQRKWKKALECYEKAFELEPKNARLGQKVGDLFRRNKMEDDAIEVYKKVAKMYAQDGFWAKAIALNKIILEINPSDHEVHRHLSTMYSQQDTNEQTAPGWAAQTLSQPISQPISPPDDALSISGVEPIELAEGEHDPSMYGSSIDLLTEDPPMERTEADAPLELSELDEISEEANPLGVPVEKFVGIPLLSELNQEEVSELLKNLEIRLYSPEALICEEGDLGNSMYIISEGWVEVFTKGEDGHRMSLASLRGGDFFGEFSLLTNGIRKASVQARTDVELLEITDIRLEEIISKYPRVREVLENYLHRRLADTVLAKSPVFGVLEKSARHQLASLLKPFRYGMDDVIMAEGTDGDKMFFIKSGILCVTVEDGKERVLVGELRDGDYFGEVAMLTGKPRTATIRARTEVELLELSRSDASRVLKGNREVLARLKSMIAKRAADTAAAYRAVDELRSSLEFV